jgi:hypothetical protein
LIAFLLVVLGAAPAVAQQQESAPPASAGRIDENFVKTLESGEPVVTDPATSATQDTGGRTLSGTNLMPTLVDPVYLDEAGRRSMQKALKAFYDYRIRGFDHRSRVFEWQLLSSRLIFGLVIPIVAVGLYFSWLQFMAGLKESASPEKTSTTLEASPSGVKVSSPVLGVIILTLSLAFFYLYLVHVYPIEEIF